MAIDAYPTREDHKVYQGDDWAFTLGTAWSSTKVDSAVFTIRTKPNGLLVMSVNSSDESAQFNLSVNNQVTVTVRKNQSQLVDGGIYWYDLELTDTGVETKTMRYGVLNVQGDISYDNAGGAPLATTSTANMLIAWTLAQAWSITSTTLDAEGVISAMGIVWPDNTAGTFTTTAKNTTYKMVTAFTVTYGALTVTQAALTINSDGNVTVRPRPTVS